VKAWLKAHRVPLVVGAAFSALFLALAGSRALFGW